MLRGRFELVYLGYLIAARLDRVPKVFKSINNLFTARHVRLIPP